MLRLEHLTLSPLGGSDPLRGTDAYCVLRDWGPEFLQWRSQNDLVTLDLKQSREPRHSEEGGSGALQWAVGAFNSPPRGVSLKAGWGLHAGIRASVGTSEANLSPWGPVPLIGGEEAGKAVHRWRRCLINEEVGVFFLDPGPQPSTRVHFHTCHLTVPDLIPLYHIHSTCLFSMWQVQGAVLGLGPQRRHHSSLKEPAPRWPVMTTCHDSRLYIRRNSHSPQRAQDGVAPGRRLWAALGGTRICCTSSMQGDLQWGREPAS